MTTSLEEILKEIDVDAEVAFTEKFYKLSEPKIEEAIWDQILTQLYTAAGTRATPIYYEALPQRYAAYEDFSLFSKQMESLFGAIEKWVRDNLPMSISTSQITVLKKNVLTGSWVGDKVRLAYTFLKVRLEELVVLLNQEKIPLDIKKNAMTELLQVNDGRSKLAYCLEGVMSYVQNTTLVIKQSSLYFQLKNDFIRQLATGVVGRLVTRAVDEEAKYITRNQVHHVNVLTNVVADRYSLSYIQEDAQYLIWGTVIPPHKVREAFEAEIKKEFTLKNIIEVAKDKYLVLLFPLLKKMLTETGPSITYECEQFGKALDLIGTDSSFALTNFVDWENMVSLPEDKINAQLIKTLLLRFIQSGMLFSEEYFKKEITKLIAQEDYAEFLYLKDSLDTRKRNIIRNVLANMMREPAHLAHIDKFNTLFEFMCDLRNSIGSYSVKRTELEHDLYCLFRRYGRFIPPSFPIHVFPLLWAMNNNDEKAVKNLLPICPVEILTFSTEAGFFFRGVLKSIFPQFYRAVFEYLYCSEGITFLTAQPDIPFDDLLTYLNTFSEGDKEKFQDDVSLEFAKQWLKVDRNVSLYRSILQRLSTAEIILQDEDNNFSIAPFLLDEQPPDELVQTLCDYIVERAGAACLIKIVNFRFQLEMLESHLTKQKSDIIQRSMKNAIPSNPEQWATLLKTRDHTLRQVKRSGNAPVFSFIHKTDFSLPKYNLITFLERIVSEKYPVSAEFWLLLEAQALFIKLLSEQEVKQYPFAGAFDKSPRHASQTVTRFYEFYNAWLDNGLQEVQDDSQIGTENENKVKAFLVNPDPELSIAIEAHIHYLENQQSPTAPVQQSRSLLTLLNLQRASASTPDGVASQLALFKLLKERLIAPKMEQNVIEQGGEAAQKQDGLGFSAEDWLIARYQFLKTKPSSAAAKVFECFYSAWHEQAITAAQRQIGLITVEKPLIAAAPSKPN